MDLLSQLGGRAEIFRGANSPRSQLGHTIPSLNWAWPG